ncbi:uncharacterized protein LY89DRAFT_739030 [Mollisia scopiformis]|uniref:2EXR domain-containing protein n=1 Tax=Mollisia scopiformis TaxID=149040 RepID=A0A194WVI0_MOLSC|nr:uncharacterized protein LY89DRAFT_739030 [Mollisia scopiformis]KUJ11602.1 hypothetical protein LY89DRAFT_739030 [Mollisia scopiformis]
MSFTRFLDLPLEIRQKIWDEASSIPRVIDISPRPAFSLSISLAFFEEFRRAPVVFQTYCQRIPSILHVPREARRIGLEHYELGFGTDFRDSADPVALLKADPKIYINWDNDIICLLLDREIYSLHVTDHTTWSAIISGELENLPISRIAVNMDDPQSMSGLRLMSPSVTGDKLREIIVYYATEDFSANLQHDSGKFTHIKISSVEELPDE